jgi:hypothetical protein
MACCAAIPPRKKAFLSPPKVQSPDLAPSDFWLFPTLKIGPKVTLLSHYLADAAGCDASFSNRYSGPPGDCITGVVQHEFVPCR